MEKDIFFHYLIDVPPVPNLHFPGFVLYGFIQDLAGQNTLKKATKHWKTQTTDYMMKTLE